MLLISRRTADVWNHLALTDAAQDVCKHRLDIIALPWSDG